LKRLSRPRATSSFAREIPYPRKLRRGIIMSNVNASSAPLVRIEEAVKRFAGLPAVDGVSLDIARGEFFALLGPSGCGKTTLLRMLAGFEIPDEGRILLDGQDIVPVPPYRRPVNMMFQSYALFPHLSVADNVAFGLRQERLPRADIEARVGEMMKIVSIEPFANRKPHQLSGGQRQRVALARALVKRPKLFLLDEPLAALDKKLRSQTQFELKELQRRLGVTFVIVTHDQEEAMIMADRIGVMNGGRLAQVGTPAQIYEHPQSRWVAEFIGEVNMLEGERTGPGEIRTQAGALRVSTDPAAQERVFLAIRPEKIRLSAERPNPAPENCFHGRIGAVAYRGDMSFCTVTLETGAALKAAVPNFARGQSHVREGDRVFASIDADSCVVLTR
jgi:putrescine transport system ATP-binding protein